MTKLVSESLKLQLAGLYILKVMETENFSLAPKGDETVLEPIHKHLFDNQYIAISQDNTQWELAVKGRDLLASFDEKYRLFLRDSEVYCGVDLEAGEFALSYYDEFHDNHEWQDFLAQDRWDDLRIAVAEVKGQDPIEVIFMSFVNEERFGLNENGWDYERLLGGVWEEIESIALSAIRVKNLAYQDGGELVSGQEVVQDIMSQGEELARRLIADS